MGMDYIWFPAALEFVSQGISASPLIDRNNQEMALSKNYALKKYFGQIIWLLALKLVNSLTY